MSKIAIAQTSIIFATSVLISGCAPMISGVMNATVDESAVHEKTAKYFGVPRENIAVLSVEKGALSTSYQAKYAGKLYNCSIYYGEVSCKQPGVQNEIAGHDGTTARGATPLPAPTETKVAAKDHMMTPSEAQSRLNQLGYAVGTPDGVLGKRSVEKLKLFQKSRGLQQTGKLDAPTVDALR